MNTAVRKAHPPLPATNEQDRIFARGFGILREAIAGKAFPAAAVAVTHRGKLVAHQAFGRFTYEDNSPEVATDNIFDLASVSKVVATTTMA
ncbi:MAG: serine hydrolase, partial [Acidobacteriales bacterium]|nr:serine hydrolase [Terriglobales bacterium]